MGLWVGSNPSLKANPKESAEAKRQENSIRAHRMNDLKKQEIQRALNSEGLE